MSFRGVAAELDNAPATNLKTTSYPPLKSLRRVAVLPGWVDIGGKGLYYAVFRRGLAVEAGMLWRNRGGLGLTAAGIVMGGG